MPHRAAPSDRARVRRAPSRAAYDAATVNAILDSASVGHLGFAVDEQPYVIPTLYARVEGSLYLHASSASRMTRTLAGGAPVCFTVTQVDGLVLARSVFHHSLNYRSVVVLGTATLVTDEAAKRGALRAFTDALLPGRWDEARQPTRTELKGTAVLALDLSEASAKVRTGGPVDDIEDLDLDIWAGHVPLTLTPQAVVPDPALRDDVPPSAALQSWLAASGAPA